MRESVIYQDILQEGELTIILRQLKRRLGSVPLQLQTRLRQLAPAQLEDLAEALLDFSSPEDLVAWLPVQPPPPES